MTLPASRPLTGIAEGPGYVVVEGAVDADRVDALRHAVDQAMQAETAYHGTPEHYWNGRVLFCPAYGGPFLDLLADDVVFGPVDATLGEEAILYTMTTSCLPPGGSNTSSELHVDIPRVIPGYLLGISVFVVLDDFSESTGRTMLLPGSQDRPDPPSAAEFEAGAVPLDAPSGSVCYLHPRLWHHSTPNRSDRWRRSILLLMVRPWIKQRFTASAMVPPDEVDRMSPAAERRLGLTSEPPRSYDEYYRNGTTGRYRRS